MTGQAWRVHSSTRRTIGDLSMGCPWSAAECRPSRWSLLRSSKTLAKLIRFRRCCSRPNLQARVGRRRVEREPDGKRFQERRADTKMPQFWARISFPDGGPDALSLLEYGYLAARGGSWQRRGKRR